MLENKMARDKGWIGAECAKGTNFNAQARRAYALPIGDVFYVDLSTGHDAGDGDNWDRAYLTVNHAYDEVGTDSNDYIIVRGWKTETSAAIIATLDVGYTHLIGHAGIMNPYFPEKGTFYRTGAFDGPHTLVDNEFIEVAGIAFHAKQGAGAESSSVSKGSLRVGSYSGATAAPNKSYIHGCSFPDWADATIVTGMTVVGNHFSVFRDISGYSDGNLDTLIYITGSSGANCRTHSYENIKAQGGTTGALATAIKLESGSRLQDSILNGIYATRATNVFNLGGAASAYCSVDNVLGSMTEATIFTGGSTCDARDTLWTNYKWIAGENVSGYDAKFGDT